MVRIERSRTAATSKAMPVVKGDGTLVLCRVRGDDRLAETKLLGVLASDFRPATEEEIRKAFGADPGSLGPVGFEGEIVWDTSKPNGQPRRQLDVSRAEELFGFRAATPLRDGLERTIAWYRSSASAPVRD